MADDEYRDEIAGDMLAIQVEALLANAAVVRMSDEYVSRNSPERLAERAYRYADAMVEERAKRRTEANDETARDESTTPDGEGGR